MMTKHNMIFAACVCLFVAGVLALKSTSIEGVSSQEAHAAAGISPSAGMKVIEEQAARPQKLIRAVYSDPKAMLSLSSMDAQAIFGKSTFVRSDLPTVIWQYGTDYCVLDMYFKANNPDSLGKVVHYEMRSRGKNGAVEDQTCMKDVLRHHARPQAFGVASLL